jgi:hypothetical protein
MLPVDGSGSILWLWKVPDTLTGRLYSLPLWFLLTWGFALLPLHKEGVPSQFSKRVRPREPSFPLNSKGESF